jgi:NAD(P)-dependent dehydrogenase (short-subunit alcohol dehydrogenase family)
MVELGAFGSIYGLVNNAGIEFEADLAEMSAADGDRILSVNLRGVSLLAGSDPSHVRKNHKGIALIAGVVA